MSSTSYTYMSEYGLMQAFQKAREASDQVQIGQIVTELTTRRLAHTQGDSETARLRAALELEVAEHAESQYLANQVMNQVYGLIYPKDPTSWEYPAQVVRHIEVFTSELRKRAEKAEKELARANQRSFDTTTETDAQRQARELASAEYERFQSAGAERFGVAWLRANAAMAPLRNEKYVPQGAFGEAQPHIKALLTAAAWKLAAAQTTAEERAERAERERDELRKALDSCWAFVGDPEPWESPAQVAPRISAWLDKTFSVFSDRWNAAEAAVETGANAISKVGTQGQNLYQVAIDAIYAVKYALRGIADPLKVIRSATEQTRNENP